MTLVSELAAPPLGSLIMIKSSPLLTMVVATMVEFLSIFVLPFVPETLQHAAAEYETLNGDEPSNDAVVQPVLEQLLSSQKTLSTRIKEKTKAIMEGLGEAAKFTVKDRNILFTLPSFLLPIIAQELMAFLLQYTSTKFGWTLAAVSEAAILDDTRLTFQGHHSDNYATSHYNHFIHSSLTDLQQILANAGGTLCRECRLGGCQSEPSIVDPGFTDDRLKLNTMDVGNW